MSTTSPAVIPVGTWLVDPTHSRVGFVVRHMGIAAVYGEFTEFEGRLDISPDLARATASGTVKVQSITTNESLRDDHLRSAEFLDAAAFPELTFESTAIEALGDATFRITGNLTIHGVTNPIVLHGETYGTDTDPWGNERVGLTATGHLSRDDYGIAFNQALGSGNMLVADKVKLAVDISAVKQI